MDKEQRERIALFRFSLIAEFVNRKDMAWGERQQLLKRITDKEWEIPGSGKTRIGRATVLRWLARYQHSARSGESAEAAPGGFRTGAAQGGSGT
jgi:hypothetical protein